MAARVSDTDVILDFDEIDPPHCAHGPALLFVRYRGSESGRKFFACSAFRDRKECSFFQWYDDKISPEKDEWRKVNNKCQEPKFSHKRFWKRFLKFKKMSEEDRCFCQTCELILLSGERDVHAGHVMRTNISDRLLQTPTKLFDPLDNNKTYAQYLFSAKTVNFILETLKSHQMSHILCVGAPRIHEAIQGSRKTEMKSLLLDLDTRYMQIYSAEQFCHYNMFNHHFFEGKDAVDIFRNFLSSCQHDKVAMVIDPPFGGMVDALSATVLKISDVWKKETQAPKNSAMPVLWFFPYFMEKRIVESLPNFHMLDYKVDYDNHTLFKGDVKKNGSPVRILTNIPAKRIVLPAQEGYRFCKICERYSAKENVHCDVCDACTSKDGRTYRHCFECQRCVKPNKVHCKTCQSCQLRDHICGQSGTGCHICGSLEHKRRECPQKVSVCQIKRKRESCEQGKRKKKKSQM